MYYITIDCGTTNSRVYVTDPAGVVAGRAAKKVGVKDTSITGSRDALMKGLSETIEKAVENAGVSDSDIGAIFSSGMITSEIGLCELPHLAAPCGIKELAEGMEQAVSLDLYAGKPVYFVRGIKNRIEKTYDNPFDAVGWLDFMRGEETQTIGILEKTDVKLPFTIVVLSSHTKFIPVNNKGEILGSLSTMSGQTYEAIKDNTFLGKSLVDDGDDVEPGNYFNEDIVASAVRWIDEAGLVRSFMFPRFMDVLLDTKWYERELFFDALIAAEDMCAIEQLRMFGGEIPKSLILVGLPQRCRLYQFVLNKKYVDMQIACISNADDIDSLSISGILKIAEKAGIMK